MAFCLEVSPYLTSSKREYDHRTEKEERCGFHLSGFGFTTGYKLSYSSNKTVLRSAYPPTSDASRAKTKRIMERAWRRAHALTMLHTPSKLLAGLFASFPSSLISISIAEFRFLIRTKPSHGASGTSVPVHGDHPSFVNRGGGLSPLENRSNMLFTRS